MTAGMFRADEDDPRRMRRRAFVTYLYGLHRSLTSVNTHQASEARRVLARLRRSFAGARQHAEAYDVVFPHDPPEREEEVWVLVGGLFALHPHARSPQCSSLGAAMGSLARKRGDSANRRFVQLLSVDLDALPHYLRQAVQLLRADGIPLDYDQLIEDLVVLLAKHRSDPIRREEAAHRIRLGWARDYHRRPRPTIPDTATDPPAATA